MSIHNENYREYLLRYLEGELSTVEKQDTERYMLAHEDAAAEWGMLKKTRMRADSTIVFPNKARLMRKDEDEVVAAPVIAMHTNWRIVGSAAAAILLFGIGLGVLTYQNQSSSNATASKEIDKPKQNEIEKTGKESPQPIFKNENLSADNNISTKSAIVKVKKGGDRIKNKLEPENKEAVVIRNKPAKRDSGNFNYQDFQIGGEPLDPIAMDKSDARIDNNLIVNTKDNSLAQMLPADAKSNTMHKKATKGRGKSSGILFAMGGDGFMKVVDGVRKVVNIKKKTIDNKTYYALVVDAGNLHIDKTIISTDH